MPDLGCWGGTIWTLGEYNPRRVLLKCKCGKSGWSTKNIGYLGARTIFNHSGGCKWMREKMTAVVECDCPASDLSVDEELMLHVKDCKECQNFGW